MRKRTPRPKPSTSTTDLEELQLAAIEKRLKEGKTITAAQMAFVRRCHAAPAAPSGDDIAPTVAELARRLGVDRRTVTWHRGRDGAPATLSVSEWRTFLWQHGKGATIDRLADARDTRRDCLRQTVEDATLAQFYALSAALPLAVRAALESEAVAVALPADKVNALIFCLWLALAGAQQATATRRGIAGALDGDGDGCEYPEAIRWVAEQLG